MSPSGRKVLRLGTGNYSIEERGEPCGGSIGSRFVSDPLSGVVAQSWVMEESLVVTGNVKLPVDVHRGLREPC